MHQTKARITVTLEKAQVRGLKNISKLTATPVSSLVRELIGEAVENFELLVNSRDIAQARQRVDSLHSQAHGILAEVESHDKAN